ncbi:sulfite exporter TauE/SafE family protein [Flammeovirgaceae bacterium SG7u.111]|nr:sulfite exporter TauE/SafE family protein [Flammeovirgaceae bacterium SG7u.132]WPO35620.1 sulfite exporter TauE/SafE family protein [Flammeovirgaceae bacterium SG7u.111]
MELWTAFTVGALGSFHCIGMCGPIALALPLKNRDFSTRFFGTATYNLGRILTYALLGSAFGAIGQALGFIGTQQWISITIGVLILLSVLLPATFTKKLNPESFIAKGIGRVKSGMRGLFMSRSYKSLFLIGLLNGLLPCGLVYLALAGSVATGHAWSGAAYMALFGLGTFPIMLSISLLGNMIGVRVRNQIRRAMPVIIACIGVLFIVRGLNLGIPYLSPRVTPQRVIECCH